MFLSRILQLKDTVMSQLFDEEIVDLLSTSFVLPTDFQATVVTVGHDEIARPDLLSKILYDDEMYADIICKINGISNPYELNEGMKLVCPAAAELNNFFVHPNKVWRESNIGGDLSPMYMDGEDMTLGKEALLASNGVSVVKTMSDDATKSKYSGIMPTQKVRTKTHKPNESLVGDKRYSINGTENVVIY